MTSDTSTRVLKSNELGPVVKLCRMLRNMLRNWPQARLWTMQDGFGVSLDAQTYMRVSFSGRWNEEDMRDCLALFATWLVAEPGRLVVPGDSLRGALQKAMQGSEQSSTRQV